MDNVIPNLVSLVQDHGYTAASISAFVLGGSAYLLYMRGCKGVVLDRSKAILITGCDSGFGFSLALHCHNALGMTVLAGCYKPGGDETGANELTRVSQGQIFIVDLDVTDESSLMRASTKVSTILKERGINGLYSVVNNAATLVFAEAEWQTKAMIQRQLEVNVTGALMTAKTFLPLMRGYGKGARLINMISFCTDCPLPTLSVYTASKAALRSLSAGLRMEQSKFGIDVVLFNPGDQPGETPLCSGQEGYYKLIDEEVKKIADFSTFEKYYRESRAKFTGLFPSPPLKPLDNPGLYSTFGMILRAAKPKPEYTNSDWGTIGFFRSLDLMPVWMSDAVRKGLMRLPKF